MGHSTIIASYGEPSVIVQRVSNKFSLGSKALLSGVQVNEP